MKTMQKYFSTLFGLLLATSTMEARAEDESLNVTHIGFESEATLETRDIPGEFHKFCDQYYQETLSSYPEFATYVGDDRYNNRWTDHSENGFKERYHQQVILLEKLGTLESGALSEADQVNYLLIKKLMEESVADYHLPSRYMPLNQLSGVPLDVEQIFELMPRENERDFENVLARLRGIPQLIDQTIALLDQGLKKGVTPPQVCLELLPTRLQNFIPSKDKASPLARYVTEFPESFSQEQCDFYQNAGNLILAVEVNPAYKRLLDYVKKTYLPQCRVSTNVDAIEGGREWYQFLIKSHTTTDLTSKEIHEIGLAEVARIRQEMDKILTDLDFQGSRADFISFLHHDAQFFYTKAEDLVNGYREITHYIDTQLPNLFGKLPKLPYEVVPVPAHAEQSQVGAYYMAGSLLKGRPGRFFVNTYDLKTRPKWQMDSLALHEAIPGHHFQISIAQEMSDMPEFRKHTGNTAYVEGWALYAESLGSQLGLYQSPYSKFGRLVEEIWRAVRLVVDTGMHDLGWSRDQAIEYFMDNTGMGLREAKTEIDRYLVWPGQALAYKIGELTIQRLRKQAEFEMGVGFDIRAFHDVLLEQGALPLDICEKLILHWINQEKEHCGLMLNL